MYDDEREIQSHASLEHFANISRGPLREIDNAGWLAGEELALTLPA